MQFKNNNQCEVDREASTTTKGRVEMPVGETITLASIGKWVLGVILIPWLSYLTWRQNKLKESLNKDFYTKEETKEKIEDKLAPIQTDVRWIRETMEKEYGK